MRGSDWLSRSIFFACAGIVVLAMASVFFFIGSNAYQTFTQYHVGLGQFFFGTIWSPGDGLVGAAVLIVGSIVVTALSVLLSAPLSVAVAVFITQISPPWARRLMQPVLELFTGIPSIIYGFLGLIVLIPVIAGIYNNIAGGFQTPGYGVIAAAIVLAVMIFPTITSISVDALASLPEGLREASLALGATRWQTIRKTLLPASSSGIFTGIILGMGRAIGETLAVSLVIGSNPNSFPFKLDNFYPYLHLNPTSTITVQLLFDFKEAGNNTLTYSAIWTLAFILLLISLLFVIAGRFVASRSAYNIRADGKKRTPAKIRFPLARAQAVAVGAPGGDQ